MFLSKKKTVYRFERQCHAFKKKGDKRRCRLLATREVYTNNNLRKTKYMCGRHARLYDPASSPLPINPMKKIIEQQVTRMHMRLCEQAAEERKRDGKMGSVFLGKLAAGKRRKPISGVMDVFPNNTSTYREDGWAFPELCAQKIGPIYHEDPKTYPAKKLGNFKSGCDVYAFENDEETQLPKAIWWQRREALFDDYTPRKSKFRNEELALISMTNIGAPLYSYHWNMFEPDESKRKFEKFSIVESRQFFCHFYEKIVQFYSSFIYLKNQMFNGYDICICGMGAYPTSATVEAIHAAYRNPCKEFGHEMTLFTMLVLWDRPFLYPWRVYRNAREKDYEKIYKTRVLDNHGRPLTAMPPVPLPPPLPIRPLLPIPDSIISHTEMLPDDLEVVEVPFQIVPDLLGEFEM